jgi:hypothetical protein
MNIVQTLNNCGPASIAEVLAYWHVYRTQDVVQAAVRADVSPYGMAPFGVPAYMRSLHMDVLIGPAGTERVVQALVANGLPPIVSQWVSPSFQVRHYRPIESYDSRRGIFVASDPYLGSNHVISYAEFARIWSVSDDRFMVIFPPSRHAQVEAVLRSAGWDWHSAYLHDLTWEQQRLEHHPVSEEGASHYYALPGIAWDQMELGRYAAARETLVQAARQGANATIIRWIQTEIARRDHHPT